MKQYYIKYSVNNPTQEVIHCSDKDTFGVAVKLQNNGVDISSDVYMDGQKLSCDAYGYNSGVVSMNGTTSYVNHAISAVSNGKNYNFNLGIQSHNTGKGEMNDAVGLTAIPSTLNVSTLNTSTLSASGNATFSNGLQTGSIKGIDGNTAITINDGAATFINGLNTDAIRDTSGTTAMTINSYGDTTFTGSAYFPGAATFSCAAAFGNGLNTDAIRDTSGTTAMTIDSYGDTTFSGGATFSGSASFSGGATFPSGATFSW